MTENYSSSMVRFEDLVSETNPVAVIRKEPAEISKSNNLEFQKSYDDLDYLYFAILPLPSEKKICLVRHIHSPEPGTEICVSYEQSDIPRILTETFLEMNLNRNDFLWIHQAYEQELSELIKEQELYRSKVYNSQKDLSGQD